jgi:hypothetical protein
MTKPIIHSEIDFPKAIDADIPALANQLICALARVMLEEGRSATEIAIMRRSIVTEDAEHHPWCYRALTSRRAS